MSSIQVQQGAKITPVPFEAGETLLSALRRAGYSIPAACGGKGRCGKCRVKVNGVPRLACKTRAQDGDWIDLPETMRGVILTDTLTLPKAQAGRSGLGAAVDLGTTTVALRLFDRADGKLLAQAQDWNAQAPYGADVISRIQHTMEASDGLGELSRCIRAQTETLLGQTLSAAGRKTDEVKELVIAGNTVMQHIFDGREVASIARAPFQPETLFEDGAGEPLSGIPVQFAPCVAGYVGGDITAGLLADGLFVQPELRLFLDIGTNGEMGLRTADGLECCSTAAGPAFEGGDISCGMRATDGAVESVKIDKDTMEPTLGIVGPEGQKPVGICGSGIIDVIAELYRTSIISSKGQFVREGKRVAHDEHGMGRYILATAAESETGREISITEVDIDSFIRAKAAIFSAINIMLSSLDMDVSVLSHVYVAGGIGSGINMENAVRIGMLPDIDRELFEYLGNTSLSGAYAMARSDCAVDKVDELASNMTYMELSTNPRYMDEFVAACFLPHTSRELFPSSIQE